MENISRHVAAAVDALLSAGAAIATKYVSERETVRVRRVLFGGKIDKRDKRTTVVVTFGAPNYSALRFIKQCKKAGEPFPVKKIQLKMPVVKAPKRRAGAVRSKP